jgi:hypothetical protein
MKKQIIGFLLLVFFSETFAKISFPELKEVVKQRSMELGQHLADVHLEQCRCEALSNRVMEQAESTRLFLQEFDYCGVDNKKSRKRVKLSDKPIAEINKRIIPMVMKEARSADKIRRYLKKLSHDAHRGRAEFRELITELNAQDEAAQRRPDDKDFKTMLRLDKSFRVWLEAVRATCRQFLAMQVRLGALRTNLITLEDPFVSGRKQAAVSILPLEESSGESWSIADWLGSIFGMSKTEQAEEKNQGNDLRAEFEELRQQKESAQRELDTIDVEKKVEPAPPQAVAYDLDEQIKLLGQSIQKLSANIDIQLKDLESLTKNIAQETLTKVDF